MHAKKYLFSRGTVSDNDLKGMVGVLVPYLLISIVSALRAKKEELENNSGYQTHN